MSKVKVRMKTIYASPGGRASPGDEIDVSPAEADALCPQYADRLTPPEKPKRGRPRKPKPGRAERATMPAGEDTSAIPGEW